MVSNWLPSIIRTRCGNSIVRTPSRLEQDREAADEVVRGRGRGRARCCRAGDRRRGRGATRSRAVSRPKNRTSVGMPRLRAASATLAAGSIAEHRDAALDEVAQQVAVVRRDLDHLAARAPRPKRGDHRVDVAPRVLEPAGREGREVGVVAEDLLRASRTPAAGRASSARRRRRTAAWKSSARARAAASR